MAQLIYRGSVKDIWMEMPPGNNRLGSGYMEFRDDGSFSIFDYGTFPWTIAGKGDNLYRTSLKFFEILESEGIETHFVSDMGNRRIGIFLGEMPMSYDQIIQGETECYRIPIECVYSKVVTPVSSLHKRLRAGKARPEDYGLERPPGRGEAVILPETKTSFSTKIEAMDVYKDLDTLARMGGLVGSEREMLNALIIEAGEAVMNYGKNRDIIVADGKLEFLLGPRRELIVADTGLSWDENRLLVTLDDGVYVDLSKQLVRDIYTITALEWKKALAKAQTEFPDDKTKWPSPPDIDRGLKDLCSDACSAVSGAICDMNTSDLLLVAERAHIALENLKRKYGRDETGEELAA